MKRLVLLMLSLVLLAGCSTALGVNPVALQDVSRGSGTVDLYLYGRGSYADPMKVAILDLTADDVSFHLMAPGVQYRVLRGIDLSKATSLAEDFVGGIGTCADTIRTRSIIGEDGRVVGYELRALYSSALRGVEDPVITSYWMRAEGDVGVVVTASDPNFGSLHCTRS